MVDVNKLQGELVANKVTKAEMAKKLGMSPKTFGLRLKQKRFMSDEIDKMVTILNLNRDRAVNIFFAKEVSQHDTL